MSMIYRRASYDLYVYVPTTTTAHAHLTHFSWLFIFLNLPMEEKDPPPKSRLIFSSSSAAPPPSPIPTAKGSRCAADLVLSEYVDKSIQIPELKLPHHVHLSKPDEIDYGSIVLREKDSVGRLLRSAREIGAVQISDHGIVTEELRFALGDSERIFGLTVECCTNYGDHEKIVWRGGDRRIAEEPAAAIGKRSYQIFRRNIENVARQLEAIARELANVIAQSGGEQFQEPIQLKESTLSIYRYHRANIVDRNSSVFIWETSQESGRYALSLHLLLESGEFCLESGWGNLSFDTKPDAIVVTTGKELEEWSLGKFKSAQERFMFNPFLHTSRPSFSTQQKWSSPSNLKIVVGKSDKIISLSDQILILLVVGLLYKSFTSIFS